ncbi:RhuM family protein [Desulfuromonas sp. CSMB_57]|uniref:RhuM family protein n=1 Tax=Desulfuromonas sp. CSMB_57 TaxID=2807629 RepID=UPI001CD4A035|nr:RhuM family protein [Desulfuromonas sp. CSMB_57]
MSEIVIYQVEEGQTTLEVQLEKDTVWLNQAQMAELFGRERSVITKHLGNVFREGELNKKSNVQNMHIANSDRPVAFYNLDVIISVGYRVKSQRGTQFRQWATRILREHLVKGYTLNEQRLREEGAKFREMQKTIDLLSRTLANHELVTATGRDVLQVITDYAYALATLDRYDHGTLAIEKTSGPASFMLEYEEAISIVHAMKGDFDGKDVYPTVEEKSANLLYFIVKNHAFTDGNKRIAAAIFIYFLAGNGVLYRPDGSKRLADNALVALTLLIAEGRPEEKDTIVKVIVNLINRSND